MGRQPKPYRKSGFWVTSMGGKQHVKLCRIEEGEKTARLQLAKLIVEQDAHPKPLKRHVVPTVSEAHDSFLDAKLVEAARGTYDFYRDNLKTMHAMFADRQIKSLTYDDGIAYKKSLLAKGLDGNTINLRLQSAKALLKWVCMPSRQQQYQCFFNPFIELKRVPSKGRERLMSDKEFETILGQLIKSGNKLVRGGGQDSSEMFRLMRASTCRPQEIRQLKWEYIRWDEHRIVFPPGVIKTRRRREVTLLDLAEKILRDRAERLMAHGNDVSTGYVFFLTLYQKKRDANVYSGKMLSATNLSQKWRLAVNVCVKNGTIEKVVNGERLVPYSFRHTRITELVGEGHDIPVIMSEAGHLNPKTTLRYVHLNASQVASQIRAADREKQELIKLTPSSTCDDGMLPAEQSD